MHATSDTLVTRKNATLNKFLRSMYLFEGIKCNFEIMCINTYEILKVTLDSYHISHK